MFLNLFWKILKNLIKKEIKMNTKNLKDQKLAKLKSFLISY